MMRVIPHTPDIDIIVNIRTNYRFAVTSADTDLVLSLGSWCGDGRKKYPVKKIGKKTVYLHRILMDAPPHLEVDHINGNRQDCRRCNLRVVTHAQNMQNPNTRYKAAETMRKRREIQLLESMAEAT